MERGQEFEISHKGVVQSSDEDSVTVLLSPETSCTECQAEKSCNAFGNSEKTVIVKGRYNVRAGEVVVVSMKRENGFFAVFLGYLAPLLLVIIMLVMLASLSVNELVSGLFSLGLLIPYYFLLFLFRKYIDRKFSFTLKA